jgi:hypothetical protein
MRIVLCIQIPSSLLSGPGQRMTHTVLLDIGDGNWETHAIDHDDFVRIKSTPPTPKIKDNDGAAETERRPPMRAPERQTDDNGSPIGGGLPFGIPPELF